MSTVLPPNKIGTGDSAVGFLQRFSFVAPSDLWIVEALIGMLFDYSQTETWVQEGTATIEETASIFAAVWDSFGVDMASTGVVVAYAGGILPFGWLLCDGSSYLRSDYPALFAAIGTVWGSADAAHFNVPDLRGRVMVGQGTAGSGTVYALGGLGGEEAHQLTAPELASHTHTTGNSLVLGTSVPPPFDALGPNPLPAVTGSSGNDVPHNTMQPFAGVNYAIIS